MKIGQLKSCLDAEDGSLETQFQIDRCPEPFEVLFLPHSHAVASKLNPDTFIMGFLPHLDALQKKSVFKMHNFCVWYLHAQSKVDMSKVAVYVVLIVKLIIL